MITINSYPASTISSCLYILTDTHYVPLTLSTLSSFILPKKQEFKLQSVPLLKYFAKSATGVKEALIK